MEIDDDKKSAERVPARTVQELFDRGYRVFVPTPTGAYRHLLPGLKGRGVTPWKGKVLPCYPLSETPSPTARPIAGITVAQLLAATEMDFEPV